MNQIISMTQSWTWTIPGKALKWKNDDTSISTSETIGGTNRFIFYGSGAPVNNKPDVFITDCEFSYNDYWEPCVNNLIDGLERQGVNTNQIACFDICYDYKMWHDGPYEICCFVAYYSTEIPPNGEIVQRGTNLKYHTVNLNPEWPDVMVQFKENSLALGITVEKSFGVTFTMNGPLYKRGYELYFE